MLIHIQYTMLIHIHHVVCIHMRKQYGNAMTFVTNSICCAAVSLLSGLVCVVVDLLVLSSLSGGMFCVLFGVVSAFQMAQVHGKPKIRTNIIAGFVFLWARSLFCTARRCRVRHVVVLQRVQQRFRLCGDVPCVGWMFRLVRR